MARSPAPPGPPPPHYRPPGTPRPPTRAPSPLGASPTPTAARRGIGPGSATVVAIATLVIGILIGFFLGRSFEDADVLDAAPTVTTEPPAEDEAPQPPGDTIPQRPPDPPTSAPPGTELAPATIGSLEDPIPAGQAYVLGLYEIEVLAAHRDAADALQQFDASNPAPPAGHRRVLVELAVRFNDPDRLGNPGSIPFFVSDGSGQWFALPPSCGRIPEDLAEAGFIEHGDEVTGQVCFTVPTDAVDELVFGTEGFAGPLYFALPS